MLYALLFDWLVKRINAAMEVGPDGDAADVAASIFILDIFGFEIFEHNSFEQLLINFANESLQQHFNKHVFKMEEALYEAEGIEYGSVGFIDNQPVLDLLQNRLGLFSILDEQVVIPAHPTATDPEPQLQPNPNPNPNSNLKPKTQTQPQP
tara:strand:- start:246 stop:698 length:453 start_codon:yes stop_codon:yes gene_type:complete